MPEWFFTENARIASGPDDAEGFNTIKGLVLTRSGNVWILEASTWTIHVFDTDGRPIQEFGRKGQGPGELLWPDGMASAPDGLTWVHDAQNGRFSLFSDSGDFVGQHPAPSLGWGWAWTGGIDEDGTVWDPQIALPNARARVRGMTLAGSPVDTLDVPPCRRAGESPLDGSYSKPIDNTGATRYSIDIPFYPQPVEAFDWNDRAIWCAPTGASYRLVKLSLTGPDTLARITREVPAVPVSAEERDVAIAETRQYLASIGEPDADWSRIPTVKPLIRGAFVDDSGRLWVRRSSSANDAPFDIYARDGSPLATVRIPHRVVWWVRPAIREDIMWLVASDDDGLPYVVRGRLETQKAGR